MCTFCSYLIKFSLLPSIVVFVIFFLLRSCLCLLTLPETMNCFIKVLRSDFNKIFGKTNTLENIINVCAGKVFLHKEIHLSISVWTDNKKRSLFTEFNKKRDWLVQHKRSPCQVSGFHHGVHWIVNNMWYIAVYIYYGMDSICIYPMNWLLDAPTFFCLCHLFLFMLLCRYVVQPASKSATEQSVYLAK